jgi:hypothetical protein
VGYSRGQSPAILNAELQPPFVVFQFSTTRHPRVLGPTKMKPVRDRIRIAFSAFFLAAAGFPAAFAFLSTNAYAGGSPTYSIDFYVISAGGSLLKNSCFRLSGTVGQAAPGYSSGAIYSLIAGYWQPASNVASDEIFYNGFEGCSQ